MSDRFLVFVPDGQSLPRIALHRLAIERSLDELGRYARVHRITEGELVRDVTKDFRPSEPDEYEDEEIAARRYRADRSRAFTFGRRSL